MKSFDEPNNLQNFCNVLNIMNVQINVPLNCEKLGIDLNTFIPEHINDELIKINYNEYLAKDKKVFCKFSPLIDPIKYMAGKMENININVLPSENCKNGIACEKIMNKYTRPIQKRYFIVFLVN